MAPAYPVRHHTFMLEKYLETRSPEEVQCQFRIRFPKAGRTPSKKVIYQQVNKFQSHETLRNRQSEASGRTRTARSQANIDRVRQTFVLFVIVTKHSL